MQLRLWINSATSLKNVNWRHGNLQPYAIAWIDSGTKCSTKIDIDNGANPVWEEKFTIPLPPTSHPETAVVYIDIVHANPAADTKPLIGSANLPLSAALNEAQAYAEGRVPFSLILERPSGRPQGSVEIQIQVKDPNINQREPYQQQQQAQYMPSQPQTLYQAQPQPQPQPQLQPQYQPRPQCLAQVQLQCQPQFQAQVQPQYQPQQMRSRNTNMQGPMRPGYPVNQPQFARQMLAQPPRNGKMAPNMRPQNRPSNQCTIGDALCTLALGVTPNQLGKIMCPFKRMGAAAFQRAQHANNATVQNNNGFVDGGANGDPSGGYDNGGYVDDGSYAMGTSDDVGGYDCAAPVDGGFDGNGVDLGGFGGGGGGGLDFSGGFDMGGVGLDS